MQLHINNETSTLVTVVLGRPGSIETVPALEMSYDAKSYESVMKGVYPRQWAVYREMSAFDKVLQKYNVKVLRPLKLSTCNQIFARDVAFVIGDKIINSNIIPDREPEKEAYEVIFHQITYNKIFNLPQKAHIEGGDVVLHDRFVFVGIYSASDYASLKTARTNLYAFEFLKEICPEKTFIPLELKKHNTDPWHNVLHLDCIFMPVGHNKAIIYKDGFLNKNDYFMLVEMFGKQNVFELTQDEMYHMNSNIFSISPTVVVSEQRFSRLNDHLEHNWGITVERIPYFEISKMGGLLRCSTLPLIRE